MPKKLLPENLRKKRNKLQKIRERKAKDKKLKDIMFSLEQNQVHNPEIFDLMTSVSTMKRDTKKYQLAKQKLGIPDTVEEKMQKHRESMRAAKRENKNKADEQANTIILEPNSGDEGILTIQKDSNPVILSTDVTEERTKPIPLEHDALKELNNLLAELESDDEETIADRNTNKDLMRVNILDAKPTLNEINRTEEMEEMRKELPVFMHEREILESVENNLVTIVCGETGSGKSTQIPQFLYEYGYTSTTRKGLIGITQPRRVAATSLSKRISDEMNFKFGEEVGYQIRFDKKHMSENTLVKLMTDGILLKELELDFLLEKYSVIIIDEAHERSINTDILISLLSRIVRLRLKQCLNERKEKKAVYEHYPLRVVIMSATLRIDDFMKNKRLFPSIVPRLIKVESRQHSVEIHFNKLTKDDYEEETFIKVCKIHKTLPPGGILVFLTGRKEIQYMVERLNTEFKPKKKKNKKFIKEEKKAEESDEEMEDELMPVQVLPLYSMLSPDQQLKVFRPPKEGHRFIVVSTNIAETSVTIPNIKYVVDCGREKVKVFDPHLKLSKFEVNWTSQASADQRAGRSGRTGPGHCYRLFSSAVFNKMEKFSEPEILRTPIDQTILQLKALGINDLCKFPFVTSPNLAHVKTTLRELCILDALELSGGATSIKEEFKQDLYNDKNEKLIDEDKTQLNFNKDRTSITDLGLLLSTVPLAPKFAKMLIFGKKAKIIELAILTVASLTVHEIFVFPNMHMNFNKNKDDDLSDHELSEDSDLITQIDVDRKNHVLEMKKQHLKDAQKEARKEQLKQRFQIKEKWFSERGDIHTNVLAIGAYLQYFGQLRTKLINKEIDNRQMASNLFKFVKGLNLNKKSLDEILNLCQQLQRVMLDINPDDKVDIFSMKPPTGKEQTLLQQLILVGFPENIAKKKEILNSSGVDINLQSKQPQYECVFSGQTVYLHRESNLDKPKFLCYKEIQQAQVRSKDPEVECELKIDNVLVITKNYLRGCTRIDTPHWIFNLSSQTLIEN